jgi:predicted N-acetyltransferase YhbS
MFDPRALAEAFLAALAANNTDRYDQLLAEDAGLRIWRWDGGEAYRPRERVALRLIEEWSAWPDATIERISVLADAQRAAIEFRIQATEDARYVEHNRSAFLAVADGKIQSIDLYCAEPLPSARRKGWIAPATITDHELRQLFDSYLWVFDIREWIPPNTAGKQSVRVLRAGSGDQHPGSNFVIGFMSNPEDADAQIAEIIAFHRERGIGFQWTVSPFDRPSDLAQRLEHQGMLLAGDNLTMARVGLDDLDMPTNPDVIIELLDGSDDQAIEAAFQVFGESFHFTGEQFDERRAGFFERIKDSTYREQETNYLARINGTPVGAAAIRYEGGLALLGGAATAPSYRSRKVYSTLLRRRLEDARARGYQVAAIYAGPMSRRVVSRYGFKEYARTLIYGWMPEIDPEIIRSLVPQD